LLLSYGIGMTREGWTEVAVASPSQHDPSHDPQAQPRKAKGQQLRDNSCAPAIEL